jgi:hypothetical protein
MPSQRFRQTLRRCLAVGATAGLGLGLAVSSARAGDDGAAPLWEGVGSVFGPYLGFDKDKDPAIDYRDRGRLVLPPKVALPAPGAPAGIGNVDWPVDPDVQKEKKAKQEQKMPNKEHFSRYTTLIPIGSHVTVTTSETAGQGAGDPPPCPKDAAPGSCSQSQQSHYGHPTLNFNPLTWVGLQKKDAIVLGPEPDRENLTDPPKGLRAPVEGPGAKIDN